MKKALYLGCGWWGEGAINNVMELREITLESSTEAKNPLLVVAISADGMGLKIKISQRLNGHLQNKKICDLCGKNTSSLQDKYIVTQ